MHSLRRHRWFAALQLVALLVQLLATAGHHHAHDDDAIAASAPHCIQGPPREAPCESHATAPQREDDDERVCPICKARARLASSLAPAAIEAPKPTLPHTQTATVPVQARRWAAELASAHARDPPA